MNQNKLAMIANSIQWQVDHDQLCMLGIVEEPHISLDKNILNFSRKRSSQIQNLILVKSSKILMS